MTEKEDYALPLWIGPLLAVLCIGLKAGITLLLRGRKEKNARQAPIAPKEKSLDSAGVHSCNCSKPAVLFHVWRILSFKHARCLKRLLAIV